MPKTVTITKTNTVVIEAKVQSVFEPKCTWFKGASKIKEDSKHKVEIRHVKEVNKFHTFYLYIILMSSALFLQND